MVMNILILINGATSAHSFNILEINSMSIASPIKSLKISKKSISICKDNTQKNPKLIRKKI